MVLPKQEQATPIETTTISTSEIDLSEALGRVQRHEARIVVADDGGVPVGAIVSLDDLRALQEAERRQGWNDLHDVMNDMASGFSDLSVEEIEQLVSDEISTYKAERRANRS